MWRSVVSSSVIKSITVCLEWHRDSTAQHSTAQHSAEPWVLEQHQDLLSSYNPYVERGVVRPN